MKRLIFILFLAPTIWWGYRAWAGVQVKADRLLDNKTQIESQFEIERVVRMIDAKFDPTFITIAPSETVKFINQDDASHWLASDPHPSDDGLAGFNSFGPIEPGRTFSFTFKKEGKFGYHDHLTPSMKGIINVSQ